MATLSQGRGTCALLLTALPWQRWEVANSTFFLIQQSRSGESLDELCDICTADHQLFNRRTPEAFSNVFSVPPGFPWQGGRLVSGVG